jgi:hypothetical protein
MSTLRVDKIAPFQSSSVEIDGTITLPTMATTGSNTFVGNQIVTGSIDITGEFLVNGIAVSGSGGGSVDTSSLATTGSNTFEGDQIVNGNLVQNISAPGSESQTDFVSVSGSTIGGTPYEYTNFSLGNYSFFGTNYQNAFLFESYDSTAYSFGGDFSVNGRSIGSYMLASGSDAPGRYGISQLRDNGFGKTFLNQYANIIHLGAFPEATTDEILIGHDTLPSLRLAASEVIITGSLHTSGSSSVTGNFVVNPVDTLPAGVPGQIAISGSAMHVYIGGQWNEVAFV